MSKTKNRALAKLNGEMFYSTGVPCRRGHKSKRYTCNGQCFECNLITKERHRQTDKFKETSKRYSKNYQNRDKNKARAAIYGITHDEVMKMKNLQLGLCLICDDPFGDNPRNMHIDHCHKTKKVRGLLCLKCNLGIGYFKDEIRRLQKAINYLQKFI